MTTGFLQRLQRERHGSTIVEFAIIAPVMMLLMMGLGDLLFQIYTQSVLTGAVQKAARDSGIEGGSANSSTIDGIVQTTTRQVVHNATFVAARRNYDSFSKVAPEPFTDTNGDGVRNTGECFTDVNANGTWDSDPGKSGQGGASAVTLYTMTMTYPRLFPVARLFGWSSSQTISATTLLKNQPYATQVTTANATVCT